MRRHIAESSMEKTGEVKLDSRLHAELAVAAKSCRRSANANGTLSSLMNREE
jgi:hypothetical protein